ncbi:MAG: glycerol acyltransferase, partial [Mycobacteriaceae bacterium]|nr:glycerol acyltransferase [Mycobacteriaceae bacterium]
MSADDINTEMAEWDPEFTEKVAATVGPLIKRYFRAEVRGFEKFPVDGGALVVSNHSGG